MNPSRKPRYIVWPIFLLAGFGLLTHHAGILTLAAILFVLWLLLPIADYLDSRK